MENIKFEYFKNKEIFKEEFIRRVESTYAIAFEDSTSYQRFVILGEMVRQAVSYDWRMTNETIRNKKMKKVY